jgi:acyl-homoserine lactone acylase PvdQ
MLVLALGAAMVLGVLPGTSWDETPRAAAQDPATDLPPVAEHEAVTILPPGQSGFVNAQGQARGQAAGGEPGAYGEHLDDQREPYWDMAYKSGAFHANGTALQPREGVRIYRDAFGVPAVYADTGRDIWFGVGYAIAQDRLFLMDAVRRMGRGTFAELVGPSGVPGDIQQRTLTYSDAEYLDFFEAASPEARDAIEGYVEGANAWREEAIADPDKLPAEYALLSSQPAEFTVLDVLAGGVLITRTVAADGGNEFSNVRALRRLQRTYGKRRGRGVFRDFVWQEDPAAAVTVPGRAFSNQDGSPRGRRDAFTAMADYAAGLPLELESGPGTGDGPVPSSGGTALPGTTGGAASRDPGATAVARAVQALEELRRGLHGGSYALAVGPSKSHNGEALLVSGPQLGYSYPSLLVELEIHGGGYDARGVSVPGLPTVGIGYNRRVAWALTTGYSKTIDSFIETTRDADGTKQFHHAGQWKDQECRTETIRYRPEVNGVPTGPPAQSTDIEVCRTVHGPIVATTEDGTQARSVQYAMFKRELGTIEGILAWNRAEGFDDFAAGVEQVTWNENVVMADADGRIAYWHPGLYPRRDADGDQRFPLPGTGELDHRGHLPFDRMPRSVDPAQGFLANWNNKPAHGWYDGEGIGPTSRPGGAGQRVTALHNRLRRADALTFAGVQRLEQRAGTTDPRAREYKPVIAQLSSARRLSDRKRAALRLIAGWNGAHFGPGAGTDAEEVTDGPAPTIFGAVVQALREDLFDGVPASLVERQTAVGSHVFDVSAADNLALRILDPRHSGLEPSRDYLRGRTPRQVVRRALGVALRRLATEFDSSDLADYRRVHPRSPVCSLTDGIIGPCTDMPYQDRGSWIHVVGFTPGS